MKKQIVLLGLLFVFGVAGISAQENVKRISAGVVNGKAISLPAPEYPAAAMALRASGAVNVAVTIDINGSVISAAAVSGHPLLRSGSEKAALEAKFRPTLLSGRPVEVSGVIVYNYKPPAEADSETEDSETEYIGIAASLQLMTRVNLDPKLANVADRFFEEFAKEMSGEKFPEGYASFSELTKASTERRQEILSQANTNFESDLTGSQRWQFDVGVVLGNLMAESLKQVVTGEADVSMYKVNLLSLKNLLASTPKSFPEDLRSKMNEIAEFSENSKLGEPEVLQLLNEKIDIIVDLTLG